MNTSELLLCVFVFLVGYMLFKRCGCTEGFEIPVKSCEMVESCKIVKPCVIDDTIGKYINGGKITQHFGEQITAAQCEELKSQVNNNPTTICNNLGGALPSFGGEDIANSRTCENVCETSGGFWGTNHDSGKRACEG